MWAPNEETLSVITSFLRSTQTSDNTVQKEIYKVTFFSNSNRNLKITLKTQISKKHSYTY